MKKFIGLLSIILISFTTKAQLVVSTGTMTPTQYVQNILVGNGVVVSNVTFVGDPDQIGEFDATNTTPFVGISNGLVLATGSVGVAVGPNNTGSASTGGGNMGLNDPDLDILEGSAGTNDVAVLEFDFIPSGDSISFNFVFGSEEYPEYVNSINDVFGFFLSGPGINGTFSNNAENIALIPGTSTEISINTVNSGSNPSYYVDNTINTGAGSIQFDGYTTVITVKAQVQCNQTYHIKIAIGDASDTSWDSGVFLEAGSFNSAVVLVDVSVPTLDVINNMPVVIEGCSDAKINFTRPDTTGDLTVHFDIGGDAINGVDYNLIADSVTFLSGQDTASITITPFIDGPDDYGQDTVIISYVTVNPCGDTIISSGSFLILDVPNIVVNTSDTSLCPTSNINLTAEAFGAVSPFTYNWTNTNNDTLQTDVIPGVSTLNVSGMQTDTFYVYVTDSCNLITIVDTINVIIDDQQADIYTSGDTTVYCPGEVIFIEAFPVDGISLYNYSWSNGANTAITSVNPAATISYYVTATNQCNGSIDTDTVNVIVDYTPLDIISITNDTTLQCIGTNYNLDLYSVVENGTLPYSFTWTGGGFSTDSLFQTTANSPTNFYLTITDDCGLITRDTITVDFEPYVPMTLFTPILDSTCIGENAEVSIRAEDGVAPYSYLWENGSSGQVIQYSTSGAGIFELDVYVTDYCGFKDTATVEVPFRVCEVTPVNVFTPNGDGMNETLEFTNIEFYTESRLVVFNRWGNKVYEKDNYQNDWDGDDLAVGTYFYILTVNDSQGTIFKGTVTLLR
ncbi:MAG: gliding motility-associated C-terminal domain-containing protein [Flavobacteriales bacterium]|nr:gliding motility-associated C-terminal domain-containing protein [Flavobacteriales bacterium]